jgi:hypothetical protein
MTIPIGKSRELDVLVENAPYPFKLSTDRSSAEQAEDMVRLIKHFTTHGISPQYADLRVKGKAYYK